MDAAEDGAVGARAVVQGELQQLLGLWNRDAVLDLDRAEVGLGEGVKVDKILEERLDLDFGEVDLFLHLFRCADRRRFGSFFCLFGAGAVEILHGGEEQDVADGGLIGQEHDQTVYAHTKTACWRQAVFQCGDEVVVHVGGFLVALCLELKLMLETLLLVDRVVELREGVGELAAGDEQLEALGVARVRSVLFGQRADLHRMPSQEGRLNQLVLDKFVEEQVEDIALQMALLILDVVLLGNRSGFLQGVDLVEVDAGVLLDRLDHADPLKRFAQVDLGVAVENGGGAQNLEGDVAQQLLGQVHDVLEVGVCLVELQHGEFRVVLGVHALVAEDAADLINLVKAADNQAFQVQLQRDAQVHVHVQGVVMGDERPCGGAACDVVQDRGLHLQVTLGVEEASQLADDLGALDKDVAHLRVDDQVNVALAVAQVGVGQAVEFFRQRQQRLGQQDSFGGTDGDFAMLGAEHLALDADDIADVPFFKLIVGLFTDNVLLDVDLNPAGSVGDIEEGGFAHRAFAHNAACNRDRLLLQLLKVVGNFLCIVGAFIAGLLEGVVAGLLQRSQFFAADAQHLGEFFLRGLSSLLVLVFQVFCHSIFPSFRSIK